MWTSLFLHEQSPPRAQKHWGRTLELRHPADGPSWDQVLGCVLWGQHSPSYHYGSRRKATLGQKREKKSSLSFLSYWLGLWISNKLVSSLVWSGRVEGLWGADELCREGDPSLGFLPAELKCDKSSPAWPQHVWLFFGVKLNLFLLLTFLNSHPPTRHFYFLWTSTILPIVLISRYLGEG